MKKQSAGFPAAAILALSTLGCAPSYFIAAPAELSGLSAELARRLEESTAGAMAGDAGRADAVIYLYPYWSGRGTRPEGARVVSREAWAPTRPGATGSGGIRAWASGAGGVSFDACLSGTAAVMPVDAIAPPLLAVPVDGFTVDEGGYPLWREVAALAVPANGRGRRLMPALEAALAGLEIEAGKEAGRFAASLVWIAAAGDLMTGRGIDSRLAGGGPASVLDGTILRVIGESDLSMANLEGALTARGEAAAKTFTFRSPPGVATVLAEAGFGVFLMANNHALDWGTAGMLDTIRALDLAGLGHVGAGASPDDAGRPFRMTVKGRQVAVWGAAAFPRERNGWDGAGAAAGEGKPGILWLDEAAAAGLAEAFSDEALDIVLVHAGTEWSTAPSEAVSGLFRSLAEAGADMVIGSHPHMVQGMDWHAGKPILWSLGNFVFPGMEGTGGGDEGLLVRAGFSGTGLLYLEPHGLSLGRTGTVATGP